MYPQTLLDKAARALQSAKAAGVRIATAETCTAGLVSGCLTSVPGASQIFERGFVLYHDSAKATGLGVSEAVSRAHGAVSAEVTQGLAEGALATGWNSSAPTPLCTTQFGSGRPIFAVKMLRPYALSNRNRSVRRNSSRSSAR